MMEYNLIENVRTCREFIEQGPMGLVYLSHIAVALAALALGGYVYLRGRSLFTNRLLLALVVSFSIWTVFSFITWITVDSRMMMFAWSMLGVTDSLTTLLGAYFFYVFAYGKDLSFAKKSFSPLCCFPSSCSFRRSPT